MIETITVLCSNRDESQHWIELLSSPMDLQTHRNTNNSSRLPTLSTHVSSCITHPPYTRLSRYFARLVRKRLLQPELLKRLLYLQYILRPDLRSVRMRRNCLITYTLEPMDKVEVQSRKSSTLKLDVKYAIDDPVLTVNNSTSLGVFSTETPISLPEVNYRSLPSKVTTSGCCIPKFDSIPFRQIRTHNVDLSNSSEDSKNWKSLGNSQMDSEQQTSRAEASLRSSDSGMADSFQHHSAEMRSSCARICTGIQSESEVDENKFADQCICSSPFGSTPRQSTASSSISVPLGSFKSSICNNSEEESSSEDEAQNKECTCRFEGLTLTQRKHLTEPILEKPKCYKRPLGIHRPRVTNKKSEQTHCIFVLEEDEDEQNFNSELYAHWWLKKPLPIDDQGKLFSIAWLMHLF